MSQLPEQAPNNSNTPSGIPVETIDQLFDLLAKYRNLNEEVHLMGNSIELKLVGKSSQNGGSFEWNVPDKWVENLAGSFKNEIALQRDDALNEIFKLLEPFGKTPFA